jgi:hypothetical protein
MRVKMARHSLMPSVSMLRGSRSNDQNMTPSFNGQKKQAC